MENQTVTRTRVFAFSCFRDLLILLAASFVPASPQEGLAAAPTAAKLTIHADRGPAMTSKTVALLFSDLDILRSHSRPYVSDDNPFSESHFRTLKYRPEFPDRFGSLEHARQVCRTLFAWYNAEHHHSGLAFLTPATVHHGRAGEVLDARHRVRLAAYDAHPERFVNGPPRRENLPSAVWINPPEEPTHQDAPGSTQRDPDDPEVVPVCRTYEPCRQPQAGQLDFVSIAEPAH